MYLKIQVRLILCLLTIKAKYNQQALYYFILKLQKILYLTLSNLLKYGFKLTNLNILKNLIHTCQTRFTT